MKENMRVDEMTRDETRRDERRSEQVLAKQTHHQKTNRATYRKGASSNDDRSEDISDRIATANHGDA